MFFNETTSSFPPVSLDHTVAMTISRSGLGQLLRSVDLASVSAVLKWSVFAPTLTIFHLFLPKVMFLRLMCKRNSISSKLPVFPFGRRRRFQVSISSIGMGSAQCRVPHSISDLGQVTQLLGASASSVVKW